MNFGPKNLLMLGIALLAACGGDAPVPPPAPEPQSPPPTVYSTGLSSIYGGTLTGGNAYDIIVVVDSAKVLWGIYGSDASTEFRPLGLLRGWQPTTSTSTRYVSTDGDMTAPGSWRPTKVDLSFDASIPSMSGSVTANLASFNIGGGRMPGQGYDPNAQPTLDKIVGNWTLVANSGSPISMNVDASGGITGTAGACSIHASSIRAGDSGKNYYDVTLQFRRDTPLTCMEPYAFFDGVRGFALAYLSRDGGMQLTVASQIGWDGQFFAAAKRR